MNNNEKFRVDMYCPLSKDGDQAGESISIGTQRAIQVDYCNAHQH